MKAADKPSPQKRLRDLKGFGPKSEEILALVDINSVEDFLNVDPYQLYASLKKRSERHWPQFYLCDPGFERESTLAGCKGNK